MKARIRELLHVSPFQPIITRSRQKWTAIVLFIICAFFASADSDKTTLRQQWSSSKYQTNSIPLVWRPATIPASKAELKEFERFSEKTVGISISKFIGQYGLPSRYLTAPQSQDYLVWDLPSGHAVALYVSKPPADSFGACVIITADGSLVKLFK